jgi:hypothetical protein
LITGKTFSKATVKIWLERRPEPQEMSASVFTRFRSLIISLVRSQLKPHYHTATVDAYGNFVLKHPPILPIDSGVYTVWVEALDEKGNRIDLSKNSILIQKAPRMLLGNDVIEMILLYALLIMLGILWLGRKHFLR